MTKQPTLFDLKPEPEAAPPLPPDQAARDFAIDPAHDVVLEASAGTGKTRVLVDRYLRLLQAGVDPRNILAITFTRKAAAEMRARVLAGAPRERAADIQISTIDAFCFSLLREFPLEAGVDPAFEIADETEIARFAGEALEQALRALLGQLATDEPVRLLLARVKWPVLRDAVAALLDRRHVALPAVATFVRQASGAATSADAGQAFIARLRALLDGSALRRALLDDGPIPAPEFRWLHEDLSGLAAFPAADPARVQRLRRRLERYLLTKDRKPRQRLVKSVVDQFRTADARRRHERAVQDVSGPVAEALIALDRDVNALLARGLLRLLAVAADRYETRLHDHALLDFAGMLDRAVSLLERQEEFSRSRLKLQGRYHHLLVDEFQDTSRLQWRLIELLVDAWGEGEGVADAPTSIFVVGDRKQSIYRFRHAEVTLLDEAARKIGRLRPGRRVRQAITTSFRAVPELLAFVNALSAEIQAPGDLEDRFTFEETDRFVVPPVPDGARRDGQPVLGLVAQPSMDQCAAAVATEIARLLATGHVRDRAGSRRARPEDVAVLFRARTGHQYFERALEARGIRTYVYKGLGFFDAPEVQDLQALLRYLAEPDSSLRAAEFLRSRFVRLSDPALAALAPDFAGHLDVAPVAPPVELDDIDRALLDRARVDTARWRDLAARVTPSELVDRVVADSAYALELAGPRRDQARENVKKVRDLIRRVENRGYATLARIADYFETLRAGDESNAIIEAVGAVNLMTIHSAKGLEFPIVFVVNLHVGGRGRSAGFSLIERGPGGEPEVAFLDSPGVKLEDLRETEELRRLCYVAVTRARDRLYLAAEIDDKGRLRRRARSLAALLPSGLQAAFAEAAVTTASSVTWASGSGAFDLAVCRPGPVSPAGDGASVLVDAGAAATPPALLVDRSPRRVAATASATAGPSAIAGAPRSERLVGTLVHRLFQRDADSQRADADLIALGRDLVRPEEAVDELDPDRAVAEAVSAYRRLRQRVDVTGWLGAGQRSYEVPFSYVDPAQPGEIVRGTLDCVVVAPDGVPTVLEFKSGAPRPEHGMQAAIYERAARAAFGARTAHVRVVYLAFGPEL